MNLEDRKEQKRGKKKKRLLFRLSILAVLLGAVVFAIVTSLQKDKTTYKPGDKAPDFKLEQVNSRNSLDSIQLSKLKGKGVMINFWATFCKPCEAEMPYMQNLYKKYRDKGIEIVAINLDANQLVVNNFIEEYALDFPVVRDKSSNIRDLYRIGPIPSSLFIDKDGVIVEQKLGQLKLRDLEAYFKKIEP